jgi:hypothetical protein
MKIGWKSLLTWAGIGSFVGFSLAVSLYTTNPENEMAVYLIYAGLLAGILLSVRYRLELNASAYAFPLGFLATSLLAGLWMIQSASSTVVYVFIASVMAILAIIGPKNYLDMFLAPLSYFGGFAVAMLTFKGYEPLQGEEGAVMSLFVVGVMGAILVFFALFARWAFEVARHIPRR